MGRSSSFSFRLLRTLTCPTLTIVSVARLFAACPRISWTERPSRQPGEKKRPTVSSALSAGDDATINVWATSLDARRRDDRSGQTRIDFTRGHRKWRCAVARSSNSSSSNDAYNRRTIRSLARSLVSSLAPSLRRRSAGAAARLHRTPFGGATIALGGAKFQIVRVRLHGFIFFRLQVQIFSRCNKCEKNGSSKLVFICLFLYFILYLYFSF